MSSYLAELIKFVLWIEKKLVMQFTDTETIKIDCFTNSRHEIIILL